MSVCLCVGITRKVWLCVRGLDEKLLNILWFINNMERCVTLIHKVYLHFISKTLCSKCFVWIIYLNFLVYLHHSCCISSVLVLQQQIFVLTFCCCIHFLFGREDIWHFYKHSNFFTSCTTKCKKYLMEQTKNGNDHGINERKNSIQFKFLSSFFFFCSLSSE